MKRETKIGIGGISSIVVTLAAIVYAANKGDYLEQKRNIISKLRPHVEYVDKQPGISFNDQLDFANRAGIPTHNIMEGTSIDFMDLPKSKLETALESYQQQIKPHSNY